MNEVQRAVAKIKEIGSKSFTAIIRKSCHISPFYGDKMSFPDHGSKEMAHGTAHKILRWAGLK